MKIKLTVGTLIVAAALCAGCASNNPNHTGAVGNEAETGVISGSSSGRTVSPFGAPGDNVPTGANGSIGANNPFGAGSGTGLENVSQ